MLQCRSVVPTLSVGDTPKHLVKTPLCTEYSLDFTDETMDV